MTADESPQKLVHADASPAILAGWRTLRDAVVSELYAVGLPARKAWNGVAEGGELSPGVLVDMNTAADDGGVRIRWHQPVERLTPLTQALQAGELTKSMMLRHGQVTDVLTKAAVLVLGIAGYHLAEAKGSYNDLMYDVLGGPDATQSSACRQSSTGAAQ